MSAHCQVTGRKPGFGKSVSHSHRRTSRRWDPNIQRKTYFVPSEGRRITLTVSAKGIKTIDRDGIAAVVARLRANGTNSSRPLARAIPTSPVRTVATIPTGWCCASTTQSPDGTSTFVRSAEMAKKSSRAATCGDSDCLA